MDPDKLKEFIGENLLTKKEAMAITGQSLPAFGQSVYNGHLKPIYAKGKIRLYLKSEVETYAETVKARRKRLKQGRD